MFSNLYTFSFKICLLCTWSNIPIRYFFIFVLKQILIWIIGIHRLITSSILLAKPWLKHFYSIPKKEKRKTGSVCWLGLIEQHSSWEIVCYLFMKSWTLLGKQHQDPTALAVVVLSRSGKKKSECFLKLFKPQ